MSLLNIKEKTSSKDSRLRRMDGILSGTLFRFPTGHTIYLRLKPIHAAQSQKIPYVNIDNGAVYFTAPNTGVVMLETDLVVELGNLV